MEIVLILLVVLIVFGVGKLPQVGGAIGKGIHEFRKAQRGDYDEEKEESDKGESKSASKPTESKNG
jgi:sec-independent protein translocase protein TatA